MIHAKLKAKNHGIRSAAPKEEDSMLIGHSQPHGGGDDDGDRLIAQNMVLIKSNGIIAVVG